MTKSWLKQLKLKENDNIFEFAITQLYKKKSDSCTIEVCKPHFLLWPHEIWSLDATIREQQELATTPESFSSDSFLFFFFGRSGRRLSGSGLPPRPFDPPLIAEGRTPRGELRSVAGERSTGRFVGTAARKMKFCCQSSLIQQRTLRLRNMFEIPSCRSSVRDENKLL